MNAEEKKFDFQNIDVKLYLALKQIMQGYIGNMVDAGDSDPASNPEYKAAQLALEEFEQSLGPLPDWAVRRNWDYSLVPGTQLCTKDGRRTGNAHIVHVDEAGNHGPVYYCITDAGNHLDFSEPEILGAFTIGDWISDPKRVLKDFDRHGHYADL